MNPEIDRLAWLSVEEMGGSLIDELKEKLTVLPGKDWRGREASEAIEFFDEVEDTDGERWLGIPRQYFIEELCTAFVDKTLHPSKSDFPAFSGPRRRPVVRAHQPQFVAGKHKLFILSRKYPRGE